MPTKQKTQKRSLKFTNQTKTKIWQEVPAEHNPYLADRCRCHGYDLLELAQKRSFADVLFLLFKGELPSPEQAELLETLMVAFINPGPRHPATRAAMNAGVGKTHPAHILPIALNIQGGAYHGGYEVMEAMGFLKKMRRKDADTVGRELCLAEPPKEGDWHIAPGFGSRFGSQDPLSRHIATLLLNLAGAGKFLRWGEKFVTEIACRQLGWLHTGVFAAALCDLGFHKRTGPGLFQLITGPGLLAHGLELANKPITAMPFLDEEHYVISPEARKD